MPHRNAENHSRKPRKSLLSSILGRAERMSPDERERYFDFLLARIDSLLSPATPPVFVRPADDSEPGGDDDLTRWLTQQFGKTV